MPSFVNSGLTSRGNGPRPVGRTLGGDHGAQGRQEGRRQRRADHDGRVVVEVRHDTRQARLDGAGLPSAVPVVRAHGDDRELDAHGPASAPMRSAGGRWLAPCATRLRRAPARGWAADPARSASRRARATSIPMTSWPQLARPAADTSPTYPMPKMAIRIVPPSPQNEEIPRPPVPPQRIPASVTSARKTPGADARRDQNRWRKMSALSEPVVVGVSPIRLDPMVLPDRRIRATQKPFENILVTGFRERFALHARTDRRASISLRA